MELALCLYLGNLSSLSYLFNSTWFFSLSLSKIYDLARTLCFLFKSWFFLLVIYMENFINLLPLEFISSFLLLSLLCVGDCLIE